MPNATKKRAREKVVMEPVADQDKKNKNAFIRVFERHILSGFFKPGDRLPPERDLARDYSISRPIIHEGLLDLSRKGFVTISPRRGTFVNDYRKVGSPELISSIFNQTEGRLSPSMYRSLKDFRLIFESEAAGQAAIKRSEADLEAFKALLAEERDLLSSWQEAPAPSHPITAADIDFRFLSALAVASGNEMFPLVLNSLRKVHIAIMERHLTDVDKARAIFATHPPLVEALAAKKQGEAKERIIGLIEASTQALTSIVAT